MWRAEVQDLGFDQYDGSQAGLIPEEAMRRWECGNPTALTKLSPGRTVRPADAPSSLSHKSRKRRPL
jgi:hypothetical protein